MTPANASADCGGLFKAAGLDLIEDILKDTMLLLKMRMQEH
jgi:hypothetical protein